MRHSIREYTGRTRKSHQLASCTTPASSFSHELTKEVYENILKTWCTSLVRIIPSFRSGIISYPHFMHVVINLYLNYIEMSNVSIIASPIIDHSVLSQCSSLDPCTHFLCHQKHFLSAPHGGGTCIYFTTFLYLSLTLCLRPYALSFLCWLFVSFTDWEPLC